MRIITYKTRYTGTYIYHLFENELDKHLRVIFVYSFAHLRAHQEERAEYYWLDLGVGGYIYEDVEGWVAGVEGGEGDAVGCEVIVAWEEVGDESLGRE